VFDCNNNIYENEKGKLNKLILLKINDCLKKQLLQSMTPPKSIKYYLNEVLFIKVFQK